MTRLWSIATSSVVLLCGAMTVAGDDTPLKEVAEQLNRNTPRAYIDADRLRTVPLAQDQWPAPVTSDEVAAAIRGWDRQKVPVDDATYRIYQQIAESKALPPGARLYARDEWRHPGGQDKYEYRRWIVQLEVMTGKNTGYGFVVREQRLDRRVALLAATGYSWLDGPIHVKPPGGWFASRIVMVDEEKDGALMVTAAWPHHKGEHDVRIVAFDGDGNRHVPTRVVRWGGTTPEFVMHRFRLDPKKLLASQVRYVGVEAMNGEGLRQASDEAVKLAKEKGIDVMPLPEVGRLYEFAFTTVDGKRVDSRKLRGKVVLVDCWASWCGPCMREMPNVKKVYEKWHEKGLEVVGISLDEDPKAAAAAAQKHEIAWPLVVIPAGEEARELWTQATRIEEIPRLLVIDRLGVLRADLSSALEIEKTVAVLLVDGLPP